jgi:hypothetical protein
MAMTNYRDISTMSSAAGAGFQFEFFCEITGETWRSPLRSYRRGQLNSLMSKLTYWFNDLHSLSRGTEYLAEAGAKKAKNAALDEAMELAAQRFRQCENCSKWACLAAWDDQAGTCSTCAKRGGGSAHYGGGSAYADDASEQAGGALCPNCQTPSQGGRFCHECGFDMASTFKSCPGCGTTLPRQARFCTDCGHGF